MKGKASEPHVRFDKTRYDFIRIARTYDNGYERKSNYKVILKANFL